MFNSFTLYSEMSRQRRSVLLTRSERRRLSQRPPVATPDMYGTITDLPTSSVRTSPGEIAD